MTLSFDYHLTFGQDAMILIHHHIFDPFDDRFKLFDPFFAPSWFIVVWVPRRSDRLWFDALFQVDNLSDPLSDPLFDPKNWIKAWDISLVVVDINFNLLTFPIENVKLRRTITPGCLFVSDQKFHRINYNALKSLNPNLSVTFF